MSSNSPIDSTVSSSTESSSSCWDFNTPSAAGGRTQQQGHNTSCSRKRVHPLAPPQLRQDDTIKRRHVIYAHLENIMVPDLPDDDSSPPSSPRPTMGCAGASAGTQDGFFFTASLRPRSNWLMSSSGSSSSLV